MHHFSWGTSADRGSSGSCEQAGGGRSHTKASPNTTWAPPPSEASKSSLWQSTGSAAKGCSWFSEHCWLLGGLYSSSSGFVRHRGLLCCAVTQLPTRKARALLIGRDEVIIPEFPSLWTAVQPAPTASEFIWTIPPGWFWVKPWRHVWTLMCPAPLQQSQFIAQLWRTNLYHAFLSAPTPDWPDKAEICLLI